MDILYKCTQFATEPKIDYVDNTATIGNQTGNEFYLKVVSYDTDRQNEKTVASNFVTVQKRSANI